MLLKLEENPMPNRSRFDRMAHVADPSSRPGRPIDRIPARSGDRRVSRPSTHCPPHGPDLGGQFRVITVASTITRPDLNGHAPLRPDTHLPNPGYPDVAKVGQPVGMVGVAVWCPLDGHRRDLEGPFRSTSCPFRSWRRRKEDARLDRTRPARRGRKARPPGCRRRWPPQIGDVTVADVLAR